jgi:gamma-glutamyl phosphate reductase
MLSERKFNIQKFKMTEEMRTSILDEVRKVIEANKTDVEAAESNYGGMQLSRRRLRRNMEGSGRW